MAKAEAKSQAAAKAEAKSQAAAKAEAKAQSQAAMASQASTRLARGSVGREGVEAPTKVKAKARLVRGNVDPEELPVSPKAKKAARRRAVTATAARSSSDDITPAENREADNEFVRQLYRKAYNEFVKWCKKKKHTKFDDLVAIDWALAKFIGEELYLDGENTAKARNTLFGTIFVLGLPKGAQTLPRSRRALQGFPKDDPDRAGSCTL